MMMLFLALTILLVVPGMAQFVCPRDDNDRCINGNFPNPVECSSFYQCSNCNLYLQSCQPGLHYSPRVDACVYPHEAKCQVSPEPTLIATQPDRTELTTSDEIEATTQDFYTTRPPPVDINGTAFFVARTSTMYSSGLVEFTPIIDVGHDYNSLSHSFTAKRSGLYFHSLSAGAYEGYGLNFDLRLPNVDVHRSSTAHDDHDTTSRDIIGHLERGSFASVTSNTARLYSDSLLATSWTVIGLTDMMSNVQAFSVGRTNTRTGAMDPLTFDSFITNVGGGFDTTRNVYVVPVDGIYFFSFSVGAADGRPFGTSLSVDNVDIVQLTRVSTSHTGVDTLCRAVLLRLTRNQEVHIRLWGTNTAIYSDHQLQTSFSGFLFDPLSSSNRIAWSVGKEQTLIFPEYTRALDFEKIFVNEGNAWNPINKAVIAPYSGYYYVHVSAGAIANVPVHLFVTVNGAPRVDLWRAGRYHNGADTLSRSALLQLTTEDRLEIAAATGTGVFSDGGAQTSFSGFFIDPQI